MDKLIDRIYGTAVDPETIEDLLMEWNRTVFQGELPMPEALKNHLRRALDILATEDRQHNVPFRAIAKVRLALFKDAG